MGGGERGEKEGGNRESHIIIKPIQNIMLQIFSM